MTKNLHEPLDKHEKHHRHGPSLPIFSSIVIMVVLVALVTHVGFCSRLLFKSARQHSVVSFWPPCIMATVVFDIRKTRHSRCIYRTHVWNCAIPRMMMVFAREKSCCVVNCLNGSGILFFGWFSHHWDLGVERPPLSFSMFQGVILLWLRSALISCRLTFWCFFPRLSLRNH